MATLKSETVQNSPAGKHSQSLTVSGLLLRFFLYSCLATTATLQLYNFNCGCWSCACNRSSEGGTYVGSMNRGQQAYYVEKEQFSTVIEDLGIGLPPETTYYHYRVVAPMVPVQSLNKAGPDADLLQIAIAIAHPKQKGDRFYLGVVALFEPDRHKALIFSSIVCRTRTPEAIAFKLPTSTSVEPKCPENWESL